jgi:1,4-dihydroxy-2-naphthoate octaprenyltransferase
VAFNSYYDQDEGPIGGLWNPPKPTRALLVFSLVIQIVGLGLVLLINVPLFVLSLIMGTLSAVYSHPAIRLKSRPWASLLTVSVGQGVGGAMAGWLCGQDDWTTLLSMRAGLGVLTTSLIATGFYPLTQIYQRAEDQRRGDITFAVRWAERCFPFAMACLTAAAIVATFLLWHYYSPWEAILLGIGLLGTAGLVCLWWRHFDESRTRQNYLRMMRLGYLMASGFSLYIGWHSVQRF